MEFDDIYLPFDYTMFAWIRPLKSGAIYSTSDANDGVV